MRAGQRLAVRRGGIRPISHASAKAINPTTTIAPIASSQTACRRVLAAASARSGDDGGRTSPLSERRITSNTCMKYDEASLTPVEADILFRSFGAEDGDGYRPALRNIIAVDPGGDIVAQPDGFGALGKTTLRARFHQRKSATALPKEIRSARSIRQQRRGIRHENQTGLVKTCRGRFRSNTDNVA